MYFTTELLPRLCALFCLVSLTQDGSLHTGAFSQVSWQPHPGHGSVAFLDPHGLLGLCLLMELEVVSNEAP